MPDPVKDPPVVVAHEGFTSTGGYHYRATEMTLHAGPIARLCIDGSIDGWDRQQGDARAVSLEPEEAADIGLWLLRSVVHHEIDEEVRALLTARIDALSRELASVLDGNR